MSGYSIPATTPDRPWCSELLIKRSRFLAQCAHVSSLAEARAFVERMRNAHPSATHHCWACVAGAPGATAQVGCSDDGEPHGTAGRPMLQVLLHSGIGGICMVVTRWFGGVKLGTGGLVRAYQDSVRRNLDGLPLEERIALANLTFTLDYACLEGLRRLLPDFSAKIVAESYHSQATLHISLPEERRADFDGAVNGLIRAKGGNSV